MVYLAGTASGTASQGSMVLTMAAYTITQGMALTYDAPKILGVRGRTGQLANGPATGGPTISVSGQNFGPWDASASFHIGYTRAMSMWSSDSSITVVVGPGFGIEQSFRIEMEQVSSDDFTNAYYFDSPVITGLLQGNGPATGGSTLSVLGLNFGTQNYSPEIHIGSQDPCLQPTWTSDSLITCTVPLKKIGSKNVVVTWPPVYIIQPSTLSNSFTYDLPVVTNIESTNGPASGQFEITIQGKNFGASADLKVQASILSQMGGGLCFLTTWTSDSQLTCNTPVGVGGDASVKVNFESAPEAFGTLSLAYTFDSPVVLFNDVPPFTLNVPAGKSAVITIQGENFGANDYSPKAAIGDSLCINTKWNSDTSLLCTVAMGILDSYSIVVSLQAKVGTYEMAVSYDRPTVTSMSQNGPKSGGSSLTLYGKNFGSSAYTQGVQIGDMKIDISNVQWTSDSSMAALMPSGRGVNLDVIVFQSDSVELPFSDSPRDRRGSGMLTGAFTFDSPGISSVHVPCTSDADCAYCEGEWVEVLNNQLQEQGRVAKPAGCYLSPDSQWGLGNGYWACGYGECVIPGGPGWGGCSECPERLCPNGTYSVSGRGGGSGDRASTCIPCEAGERWRACLLTRAVILSHFVFRRSMLHQNRYKQRAYKTTY
jgi:hypothetical protein